MSVEKRKAESDVVEGQPEAKKADNEIVSEKPENEEEKVEEQVAGGNEEKAAESEVVEENYDEYTHKEWVALLEKSLAEGNEEKIEKHFEKYLSQYVNDGDQWTEYIKWMMKGDDVEKMDKKKIEGSFFKVLTKVFNVKLWRLYLHYVELVNPITPDNGEKARTIVLKAYSFAIDTVGHDFFSSNEIWGDYLRYLYVWQAVNPNEVSTREDLIRKALRKMISYPSASLEDNWKIFTKFETDLNLSKSRKIITDCRAEYTKLKKLNDEMIELTKSIKKVEERKHSMRQIRRWNAWVSWEKENKLKLKAEEVGKRVNYVYNLSVQYCSMMPEVWFNYSNYLLFECNSTTAGLETIHDGLKVNPYSMILRYQLSNHHETENDLEKVKETWLDLIGRIERSSSRRDDRLVTCCYSVLMRVVKRISTIKEVRVVFKLARQYKGIRWNVFHQYAMIEYHNSEVKIASRTFALGMQYFGGEIAFVRKYLEFLIEIKDMTNFKKTVEVSLEAFREDAAAAKVLFRLYFQVEQEFGDIKSINTLATRYTHAFGKNTPFELIKDGLKSDEDGFDGIRELDEYKGGNSSSSSSSSSKSSAKAEGGGGGDEEEVQITNVIDGLKEQSETPPVAVAAAAEAAAPASAAAPGEDIAARLASFLQALPQDAAVQEQVKNLSIGQLLEYLGSVEGVRP